MTSTAKAVILLFLFTIMIYSSSLGGEFVSDDEYFVVKNIAIRNLENIPLFFTARSAVAFSELSQDVYRPVTTISYAIDYFLWKLDAFGYHLTNAVFHAFNAILVFLLLYTAFGDLFLAFAASMLFACHPAQTEAVSWISGRSSVLFLFFYLISLTLYILFSRKGTPASRRACFALSAAAYAASLFSKEMAVSLPLVLAAYDIHFNGGIFKEKGWWRRYVPYIALALFFVLARSSILQRVSQCGWWGGSPYNTFLTMAPVLIAYLKVLVMPVGLCAFYVPDIYTSIGHGRVFFSIVALAAVVIAMVLSFRRSRRVSFGMWWFFLTMLPVMNIVPLRALMAERFLYLPSIGFCLLAAIAIERIGAVVSREKEKPAGMIAAVLAAALIVPYSAGTIIRNGDWKDSFSLSRSILKVSPLNPWALAALGEAYASSQRHEEAIKPLLKSMVLCDSYFLPRNILGFAYVELGRHEEAIKVLAEALKIMPDNLEALNSLGVAYASVGRYDDALMQFRRSVRIDPTFISAYMNMGTAYDRMGRFDDALKAYGEVERRTRSAEAIAAAYIRMGDVCVRAGRVAQAKEYYTKAAAMCGRGMEGLKQLALQRLNAKWDIKK